MPALMIGANPDELRSLGRRFEARATTAETAKSACSPAVDEVQWEGPDADRFRAAWHADVESAIRRLAELLGEDAGELDRQAGEQDEASSAGTGAGQNGPNAPGQNGQNGPGQQQHAQPRPSDLDFQAEAPVDHPGFWDHFPGGDPFEGKTLDRGRIEWGSIGGWPIYSEWASGLKWGLNRAENLNTDGSREWSPQEGKWVERSKAGHESKNQFLLGGFFNGKLLGTERMATVDTPFGPIGLRTAPRVGADLFLGLDYRITDQEGRLGGKIFGGATLPGEANFSAGPFDFNLNGSLNAGAGAEATAGFSYQDSKLTFKPRVGLTAGVGANVGGGISIDTKPILESFRSYLPTVSRDGIIPGSSVQAWERISRGESPFPVFGGR